MEILKSSKGALQKTVEAIKNGKIVVCPTDTVYGFLADASNKKAVDKIYKIKKRPKSKPLPVFVKNLKMASEVAFINSKQSKTLKKLWPGRYTFILKRKPGMRLYGVHQKTIALRIPKYVFLQKLLKKINKPLSQTSVNISGESVLDEIDDIIKQFGNQKIFIIDGGDIKKGKPSKIIDMSKARVKILRK